MKLYMAHENTKRISEALQTPGGHLSIGRGGYTLYFNGSSRLQGYDCDQMKEACIARGLPVIDSRTVPFDVVWDLAVKGPMVAVGRAADVAPWGAFSSAPLQVVADAYRPELTKPPSGTHNGTNREHQAAFLSVCGGGRSALNPSVFSDMPFSASQI